MAKATNINTAVETRLLTKLVKSISMPANLATNMNISDQRTLERQLAAKRLNGRHHHFVPPHSPMRLE
jgi:hypothetical protein